MKKLSKKQLEKVNELVRILKDFAFEDIQVNFDSIWLISAKRDYLTSSVIDFIPRSWNFYYDGKELNISLP